MSIKKSLDEAFKNKSPAYYLYRFEYDFWYRLWIKYLKLDRKHLIHFFKFSGGFILFFVGVFTLLNVLNDFIFNLKVFIVSFLVFFIIFLIIYFIFIKEQGYPIRIELK